MSDHEKPVPANQLFIDSPFGHAPHSKLEQGPSPEPIPLPHTAENLARLALEGSGALKNDDGVEQFVLPPKGVIPRLRARRLNKRVEKGHRMDGRARHLEHDADMDRAPSRNNPLTRTGQLFVRGGRNRRRAMKYRSVADRNLSRVRKHIPETETSPERLRLSRIPRPDPDTETPPDIPVTLL